MAGGPCGSTSASRSSRRRLLAVTIGAVTAAFAIAHAIVLRPLPFGIMERFDG